MTDNKILLKTNAISFNMEKTQIPIPKAALLTSKLCGDRDHCKDMAVPISVIIPSPYALLKKCDKN